MKNYFPRSPLLLTAAATLTLCFSTTFAFAAPTYDITDLPTPADTSYAAANAVNANGWIAGEVYIGDRDTNTGYMQPVVWQNGVVTELALPQGQNFSGQALGVNSNGVVVGSIWTGVAGYP